MISSIIGAQMSGVTEPAMFSTDTGIFWPTLISCLVVIGVLVICGAVYELVRKRCKSIIATVKPTVSNNEIQLGSITSPGDFGTCG